jgi:CXXX repeat modification system protein
MKEDREIGDWINKDNRNEANRMERRNLDIDLTKEEIDSMFLIQKRFQMIDELTQAFSPQLDQNSMMKLINCLVTAKSEAVFLEQNWWKEILKKYNLEGDIHFDFSDSSLYMCG